MGLTLPAPSFLCGQLHTSAGSNQMVQIMGLIQSKLCTELGCREGVGVLRLIPLSSLQLVLMPGLFTFLKGLLQISTSKWGGGGGREKENPEHPAHCLPSESTNQSSSVRTASCLLPPASSLPLATLSGARPAARTVQKKDLFSFFCLFLNLNRDLYFQK